MLEEGLGCISSPCARDVGRGCKSGAGYRRLDNEMKLADVSLPSCYVCSHSKPAVVSKLLTVSSSLLMGAVLPGELSDGHDSV